MNTAFDTSVIVAGLLSWHETHEPARDALEAALDNDEVILPADALVESYAVMTRLPAPHRVAPTDAYALLNESFRGAAKVVALSATDAWKLIAGLSKDNVGGGKTYDARILAAAVKGGANRLLTFNARDFEALANDAIEIAVP